MDGFGLGGGEHHGGVPTQGQGYQASHGRARDISDELNRTGRRGRRSKRWWQFWRREDRARSA